MDKKEAAKQKFNERTASKRFKLPEGDTTFRVMPNARGLEKAEYIEYRMHSNVGARKAYLRCGKKISGEGECWLCDEQIPKLEKSAKTSHKAAAEALKAKDCFAVQIIYVMDGKWVGPTLWEMSAGVANKLLGVMSRRDVSHPQKGYNLTISRKGTTMTTTKYGDIDRDDDRSEVPEKILARLKPFGEVLYKYDEAKQKTEYYGHEQDDEPAEEEVPVKKPKKPAVEEEEEPVADEPEEEAPPPKKKPKPVVEEEEEEAPPPKKKPKPADADDEEEVAETEEEIPDLEEEEEAPPPKKKKPAVAEEEETTDEPEEEVPAQKKKPKPVVEEEEEEVPVKPKKPVKKSVVADDDE
jgi:hypothetical protein